MEKLFSVCPEMRIFEVCAYLPEIKDCEKNKRRHMYDIGVWQARLPPHYFLSMTQRYGEKVIYGQALVSLK